MGRSSADQPGQRIPQHRPEYNHDNQHNNDTKRFAAGIIGQFPIY